ncbi:uncharacterized protein O3C94_002690 [Discoglossus pictus]
MTETTHTFPDEPMPWFEMLVPNYFKDIKWVFYTIVLVGPVFFLIIIIFILVFCIRRIKAKRRLAPGPVTAEEVEFMAVTENPNKCVDQPEVDVSSYCQETDLPNGTNALHCNNNEIGEDEAEMGEHEDRDSVLYAELNHESSDSRMRNIQHLEHNQTEYAVVCLKN